MHGLLPRSWFRPALIPNRYRSCHSAQLLLHAGCERGLSSSRRFATSSARRGSEHDPASSSYTCAFAMFEALWEAGVTACFVNVGSDHPSVLEALVKGKRERPDRFPSIYTCPSEMTALSMADGFARVTGRAQAVIVHVDVGTQALAHGVHNASIGRAPVFIFAGLTPFTEAGELPGSRTEYMHWLQNVPDQSAIVRQYCRFTGEIRTGRNVKQTVARALQFAHSDPKGPVYVASARETLAEPVPPYALAPAQWGPIAPAALPADAVTTILAALVHAQRPLVVTGYSGRNRQCPAELVRLADAIPGLRVHDTGGSDMCFPMDHPASLGFRLASDDCTRDADVILMLDCDVPWLPARNPPAPSATIFHVDVDPLNANIPVSFFPAHGRWRADAYTALAQLNAQLAADASLQHVLQHDQYRERGAALVRAHAGRVAAAQQLVRTEASQPLDAHNVGAVLRADLPVDTTYVVEAVTCAQHLADQLRPARPGAWLNCGGTGIGWSNGAALGVRLALGTTAAAAAGGRAAAARAPVVQVVGDGSYLCAAPASAAWVAARYHIPILTILLNNGGWNAPRASMQLMYPDGAAAAATNADLNISFQPSPDYAALAAAAAGGGDRLFTARPATVAELHDALRAAQQALAQGRGAFVEVRMAARP